MFCIKHLTILVTEHITDGSELHTDSGIHGISKYAEFLKV